MEDSHKPRFSNGAYDPRNVEDEIYAAWEASGFFNPDQLPPVGADTRGVHRGTTRKINTKRYPLSSKPFTIVMPPPNANGPLHIGHAVFVTLQDIMIRFNRMRGKKNPLVAGGRPRRIRNSGGV